MNLLNKYKMKHNGVINTVIHDQITIVFTFGCINSIIAIIILANIEMTNNDKLITVKTIEIIIF